MKTLKFKNKKNFLIISIVIFYILFPCISYARIANLLTNLKNSCHDAYHDVDSIQPTSSITYFYNGSTLINAEDNSGDMSTYLDRTVRTIVNVNTQTVLDTQCLFTDGKSVISQTDSTGTNVTSTQQYNAYGQAINHNPNTNSQLSIATNPFAYDGYYNDPESGLYYLNARYYSPILLQFISMDTYELANRYSYCDGNPIDNEDPTGHSITSLSINSGLLALSVIGDFFSMGSTISVTISSVISSIVSAGQLADQICQEKGIGNKKIESNVNLALKYISYGTGAYSIIDSGLPLILRKRMSFDDLRFNLSSGGENSLKGVTMQIDMSGAMVNYKEGNGFEKYIDQEGKTINFKTAENIHRKYSLPEYKDNNKTNQLFFNKNLGRLIGKAQAKGAEILITSTGGWGPKASNIIEDYLKSLGFQNFKISGGISNTESWGSLASKSYRKVPDF